MADDVGRVVVADKAIVEDILGSPSSDHRGRLLENKAGNIARIPFSAGHDTGYVAVGLDLGKKGKDAEEGGRLGEGHGENRGGLIRRVFELWECCLQVDCTVK